MQFIVNKFNIFYFYNYYYQHYFYPTIDQKIASKQLVLRLWSCINIWSCNADDLILHPPTIRQRGHPTISGTSCSLQAFRPTRASCRDSSSWVSCGLQDSNVTLLAKSVGARISSQDSVAELAAVSLESGFLYIEHRAAFFGGRGLFLLQIFGKEFCVCLIWF